MNPLSDFGDDTRQMTGAIFTTFPFDVEFYEEAVMRVLSKKGIGSKNVVLVDSSKYQQTFDEESRRPSAGVNYHLAPVSVDGRRVFHPKIYFFGGERRVYAFVGSANLTQKGFTDNGELWSSFSYEEDQDGEELEQLVVLREIRDFLVDLLDTDFADAVGELPREVVFNDVLEDCSWIDEVDVSSMGDRSTFFVHNLDQPILGQVLHAVDGSVEKAVVAAPYFGETDRVLQELLSQDVTDLDLYLQQGKAQFDVEVLESLVEDTSVSLNIFESSRFVHGKLLLLKTEDRSYCLTGSPNPSVQGMIKSAKGGGNVEAGILREAGSPGYFDYLVEDEIVGDVVGDGAGEFRAAPEPSVEDVPTEGDRSDLNILDAVYNSETTFTGGRLKLTVSGEELEDGEVVVSGEEESFTLPVSEAEVGGEDGETVELLFDVVSEENREVLKSICKVQLRVDGRESQYRWLGHKSVGQEEIVREGVESGATANAPDQIPEFLLGEEELRAEVLHTVSDIIKNLGQRKGSAGGGSGSRNRTLPPDWEATGSSTSKDSDEFLEDLYDAWLDQMTVLTQHMGQTDTEVLMQDFARYVEAMNKATLHLMAIDNHAEDLGYENQVDFRYIPRSRFRRLYQGEGSVVATFISRLVRRELGQEGEAELEPIYDAAFRYLFPQITLTSMLTREENENHQRHYEEWVESAATNCFSTRHAMPEHLQSEQVGSVVNEIQATVNEVLSRYDKESVVYRHLDKHYRKERELQDQVLEMYARSIIADGSSGVKQYYRQLHDLIQAGDVDDVRGNASRCSAFISKILKEGEDTELVSALEELEDDWQNVPDKYRNFLQYAFPVEE